MKNYPAENDLYKSHFTENNLCRNHLTENDSLETYLSGSDSLGNYSTAGYSTENDSDENYLNEIYSNENDSNKNYLNENYSEKNYYEDTIILGYRSSESLPRLVYTGTDFASENELVSFPFIIGKMTDNVNMIIDNPMISRIHAKIYLKEGHYYIEDMNSSNGTYINNNLIQPHSLTEINTGDYITFSHLTYIFQ